MNPRRWTILIVPHGTDAPRQYQIGERGVRMLTGVLGGGALLVLAAGLLLFSPWATPGARLVARDNLRLEQEVARMDASLQRLGDSISALAVKESQFRQLAGITAIDSARSQTPVDGVAPVGVNRASLGTHVRPFEGFFGNKAPHPDVDALLQRAAELSVAFATVSDSMAAKIERLKNTPSIMPTAGWIAGEFSKERMHPILHEMRPHEGMDISAPGGSPIVAPAGGTVTRVSVEGGYGNVVEIDHGNGIWTRYAHCARIIVRQGQHVDRGTMIATVGNTGLSVGPHLHYEIHVNGVAVDPRTYVLPENNRGRPDL